MEKNLRVAIIFGLISATYFGIRSFNNPEKSVVSLDRKVDMPKEYSEISRIVKNDVFASKKNNVTVFYSMKNIKMSINDGDMTFFDTGKYDLSLNACDFLDKIISRIFESYSEYKILVIGHTDSVGTNLENYRLGEKRAYSVFRYLIRKGLDAKKISFVSEGEDKPLESNNYEEGRRKNRRAEIEIEPIKMKDNSIKGGGKDEDTHGGGINGGDVISKIDNFIKNSPIASFIGFLSGAISIVSFIHSVIKKIKK